MADVIGLDAARGKLPDLGGMSDYVSSMVEEWYEMIVLER